MTTIYFVRHGTTQANIDKIYHGDEDVPLCQEGYRQLEYLARAFEDIPLDAVYSSPLIRAVETANAIGAPHGLRAVIVPELNERSVGPYQGIPIADLLQNPKTRPLLMHVAPVNPPEGVEKPAHVQARYIKGVRRILSESAGKTVAAAVHGFGLQMYLASVWNIPLESYSRLKMGNASVTRVDYDGEGRGTLVFVDKRDFLPPELQIENIAVKLDDEADRTATDESWARLTGAAGYPSRMNA